MSVDALMKIFVAAQLDKWESYEDIEERLEFLVSLPEITRILSKNMFIISCHTLLGLVACFIVCKKNLNGCKISFLNVLVAHFLHLHEENAIFTPFLI
ncbi:hypothetical protein [Virgibacillus sp. L01]|uniref:hypothetical protein n=1 Tax=Virgibacillus sp. L01 TaxID=3457429 RepID=UPI003FD524F5